MKKPLVISALALLVFVAACPKLGPSGATTPSTAPSGEKVVLKYQFPNGRILKYKTSSETKLTFTIPFINEPQGIRSESYIDLAEEVIQPIVGNYAIVEQRVEKFRFVFYQGDVVVFDTARPRDFGDQPRFDSVFGTKGVRIRYEMGENGAIGRAEGLDDLAGTASPTGISQVFQNAQPTFPDTPVGQGDTWKSRREIPLSPGQGMTGSMILTDTAKLVSLRKDGETGTAVIELIRGVEMEFKALNSKKKLVTIMEGKGDSVSTVIFDIKRGIILKGNGRMKITTSTAVIDQPNINSSTMTIEGTVTNAIVE